MCVFWFKHCRLGTSSPGLRRRDSFLKVSKRLKCWQISLSLKQCCVGLLSCITNWTLSLSGAKIWLCACSQWKSISWGMMKEKKQLSLSETAVLIYLELTPLHDAACIIEICSSFLWPWRTSVAVPSATMMFLLWGFLVLVEETGFYTGGLMTSQIQHLSMWDSSVDLPCWYVWSMPLFYTSLARLPNLLNLIAVQCD